MDKTSCAREQTGSWLALIIQNVSLKRKEILYWNQRNAYEVFKTKRAIQQLVCHTESNILSPVTGMHDLPYLNEGQDQTIITTKEAVVDRSHKQVQSKQDPSRLAKAKTYH